MKTTVELPDSLFRQAKAAAAEEGKSLKDFFTEAVTDRLRRGANPPATAPWVPAFGALRKLHKEDKRIDRIIAQEFEAIDAREWG